MSRTVATVEVENIVWDEPSCGRPCCRPRYTITVLGQKVEVSKDDANVIMRAMDEPYLSFMERDPFLKSRRTARLSLVLEDDR